MASTHMPSSLVDVILHSIDVKHAVITRHLSDDYLRHSIDRWAGDWGSVEDTATEHFTQETHAVDAAINAHLLDIDRTSDQALVLSKAGQAYEHLTKAYACSPFSSNVPSARNFDIDVLLIADFLYALGLDCFRGYTPDQVFRSIGDSIIRGTEDEPAEIKVRTIEIRNQEYFLGGRLVKGKLCSGDSAMLQFRNHDIPVMIDAVNHNVDELYEWKVSGINMTVTCNGQTIDTGAPTQISATTPCVNITVNCEDGFFRLHRDQITAQQDVTSLEAQS